MPGCSLYKKAPSRFFQRPFSEVDEELKAVAAGEVEVGDFPSQTTCLADTHRKEILPAQVHGDLEQKVRDLAPRGPFFFFWEQDPLTAEANVTFAGVQNENLEAEVGLGLRELRPKHHTKCAW